MGNRFNFPFNNNDSDDDDNDNEFEKEFGKKKNRNEIPLEDQIIMSQQEQTDILRSDVDEKILHDAIVVASKDLLWYFRSNKSKLTIIKRTYHSLKRIVSDMG